MDATFLRRKSFLLTILLLCAVQIVYALAPEGPDKPSDRGSGREAAAGHIDKIDLSRHSLTIREGDATTTFSFDNRTIFTYGDRQSTVERMRIGNFVRVKVDKGRATAVYGTERVEGTVEKIDSIARKLVVKVGDQFREFSFDLFTVSSPGGKHASVEKIRVGDGVSLDVNLWHFDAKAGKHNDQ